MKKLILTIAILFALQPLIASASLYSYYTELGQSLPSLSDRAVLYAEIGDDKYVGSAIQNNALEASLRGQLGAVTPQPRLLGDNTWTGTNTFNGTTTAIGATTGFGLNTFFGDGSDGDLIVTSTLTLTSDKYYNNLTINSGATLNTGSYKIFVKGTLTNNGTISNVGSNAVKNAGGAGATTTTSLAGGGNGANAGTASGGSAATNYSGGGGGGGGVIYISARSIINNGTTTVNGGNGANYLFTDSGASSSAGGAAGSAVTNALTNAKGGKGGDRGGQTGGAGGVITNTRLIDSKNYLAVRSFIDLFNPSLLGGGGGGGAGATHNSTNPYFANGGGGGGGTIYYVYITKTENGTSTVSGGTGEVNGDSGIIFNISLDL